MNSPTADHMEELARRMVMQEDQAYREFADIFGPRFRTLFLMRGLSLTDAEDLAVSCVTDIALKVEKYKPRSEGSFAAWVFTLARRALADWWRKRRLTLPLYDGPLERCFEQEEEELSMDVVLAVRDAVAQLSVTDRAIVQLRDFESEHTYAEIGEQLGMTAGTVRVRHFRALKRLESLLEKHPRIAVLLRRKDYRESEEKK